MALTYGIGLLTWSPLAGGVLTGRYRRGAPPPSDSRFETFWSGRAGTLTGDVFDAVEGLGAIAADAGLALHELAHSWVLHQPHVTSAIVGPRTLEHLDAALDAASRCLSPDVLSAVDAVVSPGRATLPQYGHDGLTWTPWGPHRHAWR